MPTPQPVGLERQQTNTPHKIRGIATTDCAKAPMNGASGQGSRS